MQWIKKAWAGLSKTAKWLVLGVPTATAAITAAVPVIEQTSSLWKRAEARVEIIAPESVHVGDEFPVDVRVDSVGSAKSIPAGTVEIRTDQKYIKFTPSPTLGVPAIDGSTLVPLTTKVKALKVSDEPVSLVAYYRSGDVEATSAIRKIMIIPALVMNYPHFNKSDTNRVDLSGEWNIDFGGQSGTMNIRQATNSKISGTFRLPGYKWSAGSVEGYKDGSTFRVVFVLPNPSLSRRCGSLVTSGQIRKMPTLRLSAALTISRSPGRDTPAFGGEGVDCTKQVFFDQWEVVQVAHFNASAKFVPE
ncbi:hypothetical protein CUU62_23375 [Pseudomonas sp. WP001]|nr:hypothetical protein CUU62_23375 [Pseudomonas sp. WP001]